MNMTILVALIIACATIFVLKKAVEQLIVRGAGRATLSGAGKRAL